MNNFPVGMHVFHISSIVTIALSGTLLKIFPLEILNFSKINVL